MAAETTTVVPPRRVHSVTGDELEERVLLEPYEYICQVPGKAVRVHLIEAFNVWLKIPDDKLEIIKVITQMLHNASLMIDDIEDNSRLRRGIPVAHHVFGVPHVINSANFVYFQALQKVVDLAHPAAVSSFSAQLLELHRGQGMDIYWRDACICPTEDEYKRMVKQKTGGLFKLAVDLMQLFSENKSDFQPLLDVLGLWFQIRDDFANLCSSEYEKNKSYCEDITEGKFSFPIIHGVYSNMQSTQLINILRQRTEDVDVKRYFIQYLEKARSFEYTRKVLFALEEQTLEEISKLGGNPVLSAVFERLRAVYAHQ
ncbi:geranylgeranyl pyrophosphate synthase-like [Corticium candelabrum]|uniref:geranylgeranyl pyrophosphate synthase-like n=1 Tax=Corticium candelabrum TaxID=121492 RepID=UPI002E26926A|nr:geranylgeranyl pyrophosphate synthase-like [Corticium candelabrum]